MLSLCCLDTMTISENTELIGHWLETLQTEFNWKRAELCCLFREYPLLLRPPPIFFPSFTMSLLQSAACPSTQEFQDIANL